jgi:hypothetical protein
MMSVQRLRAEWILVWIVCLASACASTDVARYAAGEPVLDLEEFFDGRTTAVGTVTDRSGDVTRRFRATADGTWSEADQALTVKEAWYWDDGEVEPRLWRWEKQAGGVWRGFEDDLVGDAEGRAAGNTVHWKYTMVTDTNAYGRVNIFADDVMHLVDEDNIINLVDMYFWGFYVGQVVLHIQRGDGRDVGPWPGAAGEGE